MKKVLSLTVFLAIIGGLSAFILSFVNSVTAPIIEEQGLAAEKETLELLYPGGTFSQLEYEDETGLVTGAYLAEGQGYIYKLSVTGYNSSTPIEFMVAFSNESDISGYIVISQQETSGIGTKITEDAFADSIVGSSVNDSISTISGATVSSSAVIKGINAAKTLYGIHAGIDVEVPTEPEKPPVTLNDDFKKYEATITDISGNVYTVTSKGYSAYAYDDNKALNEFKITVENGVVVNIEMTVFKDTPDIGDAVDSQKYYETLYNKSLEDEVDVVSGATKTSESLLAAIQVVLKDANGIVDPTIGTTDFSAEKPTVVSVEGNTYTVKAVGYYGDNNQFEVVIENGAITSVKVLKFYDTEGIGDLATSDDVLNSLVGATIDSDVDIVSGATYTSRSLYAALQAALNAANE